MNTLIFFDESTYENEKADIKYFIPEIQKVVDAYNLLELEPLKSTELQMLFLQTDEFIFDKMTGKEPLLVNGMEVHKHEAIKLLKKPLGYENLILLISQFKEKITDGNQHRNLKITLTQLNIAYELNSNGEVIFKASKDEELQRINKKYATTPIAEKLFKLANLIIDECKEDQALSQIIKNDRFMDVLRPLISTRHPSGQLGVNIQEILRYNQ